MKNTWEEWEELCDIWGKNILGRTKCKSPEMGVCLIGLRKPAWLEWSKPDGDCLAIRSEK